MTYVLFPFVCLPIVRMLTLNVGKLLITVRSAVDELAALGGSIPIAEHEAITVAAALADKAIIRGGAGFRQMKCFAVARVASIHASSASTPSFEFRLDDLRFLSDPIEVDAAEVQSAAERSITVQPLSDEAARVVLEGYDRLMPAGLEEEQAAFALDQESSPEAVVPSVLAAYGDMCAFTGTPLLTSSRGRTLEPIAALRPLAMGGRISADNLIPAIPEARIALESGHLTLGDRFEFIAALDKLEPELLEMLNANGRLRLPDRTEAMPSPAYIAYHQSFVFNRPL